MTYLGHSEHNNTFFFAYLLNLPQVFLDTNLYVFSSFFLIDYQVYVDLFGFVVHTLHLKNYVNNAVWEVFFPA